MHLSPERFSLWLIPAEPQAQYLREIIGELSERYEAPVFAPHITLLGGIRCEQDRAVTISAALLRAQSQLNLKLGMPDWRAEYFQCLFAHVRPNTQLLYLRSEACQLFDMDTARYMPHISLLYGEYDVALKKQLAEEFVRRLQGLQFTVKEVRLYATGENPADWHTVASFALRTE